MDTEREWHVSEIPQGSETGYAIYDQNDPRGRDIAFLYPASDAKENATLMAATPDLLNALRELEEQAHKMDNMHHAGIQLDAEDWSNLYCRCVDARAVIDKAES